jgi:predicted ATPase/class 3 adenylate cyclase
MPDQAKPPSVSATPRERLAESLPSGTVTFVFSDIADSTQRWDRDRAAMQDAVRRHDAIMRNAIAAHRGHVFKTIGDAFCVAFWRPEDAVGAMLDAQRALGAQDFTRVNGIRVRMAIHTGTADERDSDYFGPAVNRVARLLGIAHGGQVLVSGITSQLVQGVLPPDVRLRDLGEHRLKDLARPEHVHQLLGADLVADFPPLRSLGALPNNLPVQVTTFVGREKEVAEISSLIEQHRLVTLVGSGGIGKTRTSLHVAAYLLDRSADGVWFIELAPLANADLLPTTIANELRLTLAADGDPLEQLVRGLGGKHALLIFDNCEHLVEGSARVVAAILRGCPEMRVLASSRQPLGIDGERRYHLPSLAVPTQTEAAALTAASAQGYAGLALFADRAQGSDHRFALTDENAPVIADICRQLDGIPLAIELASARVKILSPWQLRDKLAERFRLLTGSYRDVLPRHQTLRALIDWSYDLLDERERALFRQVSIFVSGFALEGALAVGCSDDLDEFELVDVLGSLVDKSLVLAEPVGDTLRYRLLESTRAYAGEKLDIADERGRSAERHLRFMRDRFAALDERGESTGRRSELEDVVATELDDIRVALDFALNGNDVPSGAALLAATRLSSWRARGLENEALVRAEQFLAKLSPDQPLLAARLWTGIANIAAISGRRAHAMEAATHGVACARAAGDARVLAQALCRYALAAMLRRDLAAAEDALAEAEALANPSAAQRLLLLDTRAMLSGQQGDAEAAVRATEHLLREYRLLGNAGAVRYTTLNLAESTHAMGETARAIDLIRDALPDVRAAGNRNMLVMATVNLAGYLAAADRFSEASAIALELIGELAPHEPTHASIAVALEPAALALAFAGDLTRAATLEGYAEAALREHGFARGFTETTTHDRLLTLLTERLTPDDLAHGLAEGAALTPQAAVELALRSR